MQRAGMLPPSFSSKVLKLLINNSAMKKEDYNLLKNLIKIKFALYHDTQVYSFFTALDRDIARPYFADN